ncbi:hypothetical protein FRB99_002852 [Tulasnella sp. 403]|nr:hypothetical protein FRB99_002852 [Tulasnella sp. 403]
MTPKTQFDPETGTPDLSGKVMIAIGGGNTGISKETAKELLKKNAKVYMASRSKARAGGAIAELKRETGKEASFLQLDLASLDSVAAAANEFKSKEKALHALFDSGGVMIPPVEQTTSDGYDLQFGTNVLGHAYFTLSQPRTVEGINSGTLADGPVRRKYSTAQLYAQSKLGNCVFSNELARRYGEQEIVSNACHPGYLTTGLQRNAPKLLVTVAMSSFWSLVKLLNANIPRILGLAAPTRVGRCYRGVPVDRKSDRSMVYARVALKFKGSKNIDELGPRLWTWVEEQRKTHL